MTVNPASPHPETLQPSQPRAGRFMRGLGLLALLALAVVSIWWIDRGVMQTNVRPAYPAAKSSQ